MAVTVHIISGSLPRATSIAQTTGAGALLVFEGIVRPLEGERPILALLYEAYRPMADNQLRQLGEDICSKHGLLSLDVQHSEGHVAVGQCSFRLSIASRHRKEALAAMDEFIDRMKQEVPIWKTPIYEDS